MTYGLQLRPTELNQYVYGTLPRTVVRPDGDWTAYLPQYEPQAENYETDGCTVWGTQNAIEILHKALYDTEPNYSERFTYLRAGIRPPGGDPHRVAEVIRKEGLVDASVLPVPPTWEEFIDDRLIDGSMLAQAQRWLMQYDFQHEWLWKTPIDNHVERMREELQYSPLGVSVTAWNYPSYQDFGKPNNHWCVCFKIDTHLHIFDSYDHSIKLLPLEHNIQMCKRYYLGVRTYKCSWLSRILGICS